MKIKFKNEIIEIKSGTTVLDLLTKEEKTNYCVAQVGKQIKELRYILTEKNENKEIILKDINDYEGGKAYEASLRFIVAMAFHNLYPDIVIRFGYNISRSIFCEVLTKDVHLSKISEEIREEIDRIISANYPIERITVSVQEAISVYEKMGLYDKMDILQYRPDATVHLHRCNGYYNYMHGYVVPSTGCIQKYNLKPYSPGIIFQYPRYELRGRVPKFFEESTYGKTLREAKKWGETTNTDNIVKINKKLETSSINDFIQMCETKHTNMLAKLGEQISNDRENIRLIAIAGPSSSGKTTFCNRLRIELMSKGINPVMISMDDYYLTKEDIAIIQNVNINELDLEHLNTLDIAKFNEDLFDLINGETVTLPKFNFTTGKRELGRVLKLEKNMPIIIEGIHALNEKLTSSIPKHQKFKIFIAPQMQINIDNHNPLSTTDLRLLRRIVRDMNFRACPASDTIDMWSSVRQGEFKWIYPNQEGADFVFNSELTYELAVMRKHALPALQKIGSNDDNYLVANRLIKYLKYFRSIDNENIIPCNSLIREFIGGSCFNV